MEQDAGMQYYEFRIIRLYIKGNTSLTYNANITLGQMLQYRATGEYNIKNVFYRNKLGRLELDRSEECRLLGCGAL
jgi:hypothetical protein